MQVLTKALFVLYSTVSKQSNSIKIEATNQLSESEDENIIDPVMVAVNSGALLSAPQATSIAWN